MISSTLELLLTLVRGLQSAQLSVQALEGVVDRADNALDCSSPVTCRSSVDVTLMGHRHGCVLSRWTALSILLSLVAASPLTSRSSSANCICVDLPMMIIVILSTRGRRYNRMILLLVALIQF